MDRVLGIEYKNIEDLKPYENNSRTHSEEQIKQIVNSMKEFGWTNPILLDGNNGIIAGHARLKAAWLLGMSQVPCVELDGLSEAQKRAYIIADNKLAINAGWDTELLSAELQELKDIDFDLDLIGFDENELDDLLKSDQVEGLTDPDDAPEIPEQPVTVMGDLWVMGKHRLLCGDSKNTLAYESVTKGILADLLITDPPYGVSYADKNRFLNAISRGNLIQEPIKSDHQKPEEMSEFWTECFSSASTALKEGAAYYVTGAQGGDLLLLLLQSLRQSGFPLRHMLIWAKNNHVLGRCDYHYKHEPIIYGWRNGSHVFYGGHGQTSLWEIPKPLKSDLHPTQKPVELYLRAINNSSKAGDLILEPFSGSGTALISAEQTGRNVAALEIDPHYVDVAVERWQNYTGKDAILESDGRTFNEIKAERLKE